MVKKSYKKRNYKTSEKLLILAIFVMAGIFTLFLVGVISINPNKTNESLNNNTNTNEEISCLPSQRNADACIMIYDPVCGWFDKSIQCIAYPCADTYANSCLACSDEKVSHYTPGECPSKF